MMSHKICSSYWRFSGFLIKMTVLISSLNLTSYIKFLNPLTHVWLFVDIKYEMSEQAKVYIEIGRETQKRIKQQQVLSQIKLKSHSKCQIKFAFSVCDLTTTTAVVFFSRVMIRHSFNQSQSMFSEVLTIPSNKTRNRWRLRF